MSPSAARPRSRRRRGRWILAAALLVLLAALRLPWLAADSGNSVFWSFAYFSYDEAAYTSGGRLAVLTGQFLDPDLSEPHTFGSGWAMHFLAWLGYRAAGLSLSAMRWPVALLAIAAWLAVYGLLTRRSPPLLAALVVALISCNPVTLTYERTASTDIAVGALALLAFALATARRPAWSVLAGASLAFACCIKANAVVLAPLVILGISIAPTRRSRRLILLVAAAGLGFAALWSGRNLAVHAAANGHDPALVLDEASRFQYSVLNLHYRPADWFKPLSVFPRWPNSLLLGPFVLWAIALPAWWWLLFWRRTGRWWTRHHVVPAAMLIYCAALAAQPNNAVRHYLPLLFLAPLLLARARCLVRPLHPPPARSRSAGPVLAAALLLTAALYWWQTDRGATADRVRQIAYNEVTVPHNAWLISGPRLIAGWLVVTAAVGWALARRSSPVRGASAGVACAVPGACSTPADDPSREDTRRYPWETAARSLLAPAIAIVFTPLFFANYTISLLNIDIEFVVGQLLLQLALGGGLVLLFCPPLSHRPWRAWYLFHLLLLLVFMAGHRHWSQAYAELGVRSWSTRDAAGQLAAVLPPDAVVIGRRASTLLRAAPVRVGMCTLYPPEEFVEKVDRLLAAEPAPPLFWLVDGDDDLQWERCRDLISQRRRIRHVTTVELPSGDLLRLRQTEERLPLVRIHLMRIHPRADSRSP